MKEGELFDVWNEQKKRLDRRIMPFHFFIVEGEVWYCAIGCNVGIEMDGKHDYSERPVIVIRKFGSRYFWGVPLTSTQRNSDLFYQLLFRGQSSCVSLAQLRIYDARRLLRCLGRISHLDLRNLRQEIIRLIK